MATSRRCGFSLIELLVVMAIVAVLAGMLMPALGTVRQAVRGVACVSNLRQLGLAAQGYALDWDGQLVPAFWSDAAGNASYGTAPWVLNADFLARYAEGSETYNVFAATSALPAKLLCPENLRRNPSRWIKSCYGLNWSAPGYARTGATYPLNAAIAPRAGLVRAEIVMFADGLDWLLQSAKAGDWTAQLELTGYVPSTISYRHRNRTSAVCFDGSALALPMSELSPATTRWK
ncbi:MAG: type II secretion system GspH family protein [Planctomycetes bacterium]|nr:type II secretion system GspH family protein [Planctomycetota bacterium]